MYSLDYALCEPLRAWNRIEPRPRQKDFGQTLQAQVHDALWMLTRQWQFGEFQGEDTGSAVMAKMALEISRIAHYQNTNGSAAPYDDQVPLEARVERKTFSFDLRTRVQTGQQWLKFVDYYGDQYNLNNQNRPNPGRPYQAGAYQPVFVRCFPLPDLDIDPADPVSLIERTYIASNKTAHQFLNAAAPRALDGIELFKRTSSDPALITWPPEVVRALAQEHLGWINQAAAAFNGWVRDLYYVPEDQQDQAWNPQSLEYQFACAISDPGGKATVLQSDDYYQGHLDWFAFDLDPNRATLAAPNAALPAKPVENRVISVIPTEARFGGMPAFRWWEFEDSCVDLGNIQADTTDLAKILLAEFALMYSNDWFLVPVKIPVGSMTKVKGLVVTDVFGQRTLVEPAGGNGLDDWSGWNLFHLTVKPKTGELHGSVDPRLFLPPAAVKILESEPVEEVRFIRDETTNMVWAVETQVSDMLGQGQDGHSAGRQLRTLLENMNLIRTTSGDVAENAVLSYQLSNSVPENWIPFIPVHVPGNTRAIQLQRGSMPRILTQGVQPVRPRTFLLRPELNLNQSQSQLQAYLLHEEEITRAGVTVAATFQRARWYNGAAVTWYGNQKTLGRGEGSSGLKFDVITPVKN